MAPQRPAKRTSTLAKARVPGHAVRADLAQRYALGWHGLLLGSLTLLTMWGTAHLLMLTGVQALWLRYALVLGAGYAAYLLAVRWWAAQLLRRADPADGALDALANLPVPPAGSGGGGGGFASGGGGDFGGGGASGDFGAGAVVDGLGNALGGAAEADEAAVVVVPVVALFAGAVLLVLGTGALVLLLFGSEVLLAVAVEVAFGYAGARTAARAAREGWLLAAWRVTWKPMLGALLCAVALGAAIDWWLPQAQSLPHALRLVFR